jgi:hypothetical protein
MSARASASAAVSAIVALPHGLLDSLVFGVVVVALRAGRLLVRLGNERVRVGPGMTQAIAGCSISESHDALSCAMVPPSYGCPHTFVKIVDDDLCHDLDSGDGASKTDLPRHKETDDECVDARGNSPTDGFGERPGMCLSALEQVHLGSTRRLDHSRACLLLK